MCGAKDSLNKEELSNKVKNYRNTVLILYQYKVLKYLTCKIKIFYTVLYKYFHYSKLNIFQTWKGIREITKISKKGSNNINCIQIGKNTITNLSDIAKNSIDISLRLPKK